MKRSGAAHFLLGLALLSGVSAQDSGPAMTVTPSSLSATAPQDGPNPYSQTVTVQNTGTGPLGWQAAFTSTWLSVAPASGTLLETESANLTVAFDVTNLQPGTYTDTITISDAAGLATARTVGVTLEVTTHPAIQITPASLTFWAAFGGPNPPTQAVTVQNTGGGTLSWNAQPSASWLSATPVSDSLGAGSSQALTVSIDTQDLAVGDYTGSIRVSDPLATNSPQSIAVTLHVTPAPSIVLTPLSVTFEAAWGGAPPPSQLLTLANQGGGQLNWTASSSAPWLGVGPGSGTLISGHSTLLSLWTGTSSMGPGTYSATVTVADPSAANSPVTVAVTLNVNDHPKIGVAPASLFFDGPDPSPAGISITNVGTGSMAWQASGGASWIELSSTGGSLRSQSSTTVAVSVHTGGLKAGTHRTSFQITSSDATNSPQTVSVTLDLGSGTGAHHSGNPGGCGLLGPEFVALLLAARIGGRRMRSRARGS